MKKMKPYPDLYGWRTYVNNKQECRTINTMPSARNSSAKTNGRFRKDRRAPSTFIETPENRTLAKSRQTLLSTTLSASNTKNLCKILSSLLLISSQTLHILTSREKNTPFLVIMRRGYQALINREGIEVIWISVYHLSTAGLATSTCNT